MTPRWWEVLKTEDDVAEAFAADASTIARIMSAKFRGKIPAEDLRQAALLGAVLAFRAYSPATGVPLVLWIRKKMRYAVFDAVRDEFHLRRRDTGTAVYSIDADDEEGKVHKESSALAAPDSWAAIEAAMDVDRLLGSLPAKKQSVVRQLFMSGKTLRVVAADHGVSEGRVWQIRDQALKAMRAAA